MRTLDSRSGAPPAPDNAGALRELSDDDGAFSGSPQDLERMLRDGAPPPPSSRLRWPAGASFALAAAISLGLWAVVLLLLLR